MVDIRVRGAKGNHHHFGAMALTARFMFLWANRHTDPYIFDMIPVGRICLNIKTVYLW